jgi:hypothetical protein
MGSNPILSTTLFIYFLRVFGDHKKGVFGDHKK